MSETRARIAWFDAPTGIAGDMAVAALIDAGFPIEEIAARVEAIGVPGLRVHAEKTLRGGLSGTRYVVEAPHEHEHRGLREILPMLERAGLAPPALVIARLAFERLAAVEARLHGTTPDEVHFHEVGAADAIADVVGFAVAFTGLGLSAGEACVSPLPLSHGRAEMAHGSLPVPAPATLALLEGFEFEPSSIRGELVTPTGAALLATVARPANRVPRASLGRSGYGAGTREIDGVPNLLRVVLFERAEKDAPDRAVLLEANVDDMTPELAAAVAEKLLTAGALDSWITPVQMKKGRPGILLSALVAPSKAEALSALLLAESTTIGVRSSPVERRVLPREIVQVPTEFGTLRVKIAFLHGRPANIAPEFEDARAAAEKHGAAIKTVLAAATRAAEDLLARGTG